MFPADDMSVPDGSVGLHVAGGNSLLPEEDCEDFAQIPIIKAFSDFDSVSAPLLIVIGSVNRCCCCCC